jgi:hypothetical protein
MWIGDRQRMPASGTVAGDAAQARPSTATAPAAARTRVRFTCPLLVERVDLAVCKVVVRRSAVGATRIEVRRPVGPEM